MQAKTFSVPDEESALKAGKALLQGFSEVSETNQLTELELFDSFDWRLFANNRLLVHEDGVFKIIDLDSYAELASLVPDETVTPRFWWELPESALRGVLKDALDIRALIKLTRLKKKVKTLHLLNEDQKTVSRVIFETVGIHAEQQHLATCKLVPVRGYRQECRQTEKILIAAGLRKESESAYLSALKSGGLHPGGYSKKINLRLPPDMASDKAAKVILKYLFETMQANENGIRDDIDSEFLHDFRVSVRRARSLLAQLKDVFAPAVTLRLKADLQTLGKATNALRDLDVYLLKKTITSGCFPKNCGLGLRLCFRRWPESVRRNTRNLSACWIQKNTARS